MKRSHAAALAVTVCSMTAGVGGRIAAGPLPVKTIPPARKAPGRNVIESIPKASLFLGLRMQNGRMYAVNGSGGADVDVTPRIITGPFLVTPPGVRALPRVLPPGVRILPAPLLPKAPAPHR